MSTLQIDLDEKTGDALTSLAAARGTTPADLASQIVAQYVRTGAQSSHTTDRRASSEDTRYTKLTGVPIHEVLARADTEGSERGLAPPDPLDALVGRYDAEPGDIDEIVYGR